MLQELIACVLCTADKIICGTDHVMLAYAYKLPWKESEHPGPVLQLRAASPQAHARHNKLANPSVPNRAIRRVGI
jgi:hypothetical protein